MTRSRRLWAYGPAFAACLAAAAAAQAQEPDPSPPAPSEVPITEEARAHFQAGVNFLQDPDGARYEEAYREFKAAYASSPSWKILGNLGLTAMKLERDGEAIQAYEKYLAEGGDQIDPAERAQVERDLATLKASLVTVTLSSVPAGATITDERVPNQGGVIVNRYPALDAPAVLGIRPGHHKITATLAGHDPQVWEFDAASGGSLTHAFELVPTGTATASTSATLTPPAAPMDTGTERPIPTGVYIGAAATGALAVGAIVTGILASSKKSEFDDANDGTNPRAAEDLKDSGETLNLVTDVFIGGAVVAGAVTAVLYFTRPAAPAQRDTRALRIRPLLGRNAGALTVSGSF